jgi:hypothetical protein
MPALVSKADANYREGTRARHCGLCTMFIPPHSCTKVRGKIEAADLCDYFQRKPSVVANISDMMKRRNK